MDETVAEASNNQEQLFRASPRLTV